MSRVFCFTDMGHIFWNDSSRLQDSGEQIDELAIGDSWFHYPFNNLISPLFEALERPTIYVIVNDCWSGPARHALGLP